MSLATLPIDPRSQIIHSDAIAHSFDQFAGASFGVALFQAAYERDVATANPLLVWSLISRSLIDGAHLHQVQEAHQQHLDTLLGAVAELRADLPGSARFSLLTHLRQSWACWLPLLLFSPPQQRTSIWQTWTTSVGSETPEEVALQTLLSALLSDQGYLQLFSSIGLDAKFAGAGPAECAVIRIGKLLRDLHKGLHQPEEARLLYDRWRVSLYPVLAQLQQSQRVTRGFAETERAFEDLVLAILAVAEWRLQPELWRIYRFIEDVQERTDERLNTNQLVLAGALFGLLEGYRHLGAGISDRELRQHLARYALALAVQYHEPAAPETIAFYVSTTGVLSAKSSALQVRQVRQELIRTFERTPEGQDIVVKAKDTIWLDVRLADMTKDYRLIL